MTDSPQSIVHSP